MMELRYIFAPVANWEYLNKKATEQRSVRLQGEAYFDVTENPEAPFQISTTNTQITVLGTRFNVRARATEPQTTVTVESGKVRL